MESQEKLTITDIYIYLKNSIWIDVVNAVMYTFEDTKLVNSIISGVLSAGNMVISFEIDRVNTADTNLFNIDDYLFEVINENIITVIIKNDEDNKGRLKRMF